MQALHGSVVMSIHYSQVYHIVIIDVHTTNFSPAIICFFFECQKTFVFFFQNFNWRHSTKLERVMDLLL